MSDEASPDPAHFARAVTQLGDKQKVVSSTAIFNAQGLKVIDKGVTIDAKLYERLTQHQLRQPLAQCVEAESSVNAGELREEAAALIDAEPFFAAMYADERQRDMQLEEMAQIPLPQPIVFQLTLARANQPELWQHSLRCALMAGWLVGRLDGTRHDRRMLAAAGLLHDLGMLHIDPILMQPAALLDRALRRQLYTHPLVATMLLERHHGYPRAMLSAILEHHERLDGSGYPRNLSGDSQSPWGRILALCELVTAMVSNEHRSPMTRLSVVLRMNRSGFDERLVQEVQALLQELPDASPPDPVDGVVGDLSEVDRLLRQWPDDPPADGEPSRAAGMRRIGEQCAHVLRQLADVGASAEQLALLVKPETDAGLGGELALILQEAAWQLRLVSRQARRRWAASADETLPPWLADWLAAADAHCDRCLGMDETPVKPAAEPVPGKGAGATPDATTVSSKSVASQV